MKKQINLLPHREEYCLLIPSAFTDEFCDQIIAKKKNSFKKAITHYPTSYRNNERQVTDNKQLSEALFSEIKNHIPDKIKIEGISLSEHGTWEVDHLNPRIRICRYLKGQYFHKHLDGIHFVSETQQSKLTFMIYLNGEEGFTGGKTLFFNSKKDDTIIGTYEPKKGDLIIFDHNLWHSGATVTSGEKYILRSDIIYRRIGGGKEISQDFFAEGHLGYIWTATPWNDRLLTSGRDKKIKIWSKEGVKVGELLGHESSILKVIAFDKTTILSASRDRTIKIWNHSGEGQFKIMYSVVYHEGAVLALCKMNDKEFLSGGADGLLNRIRNNGELVETIHAHDEWIWGIAKFLCNHFATISEDGCLKIWEIHKQKEVANWYGTIPINSIAIEDSRVYVGRLDGSILIFNFDEKENSLNLIFNKKCHDGIIRKMLITSQYLYSASEDNTAKKWTKDELKEVETIHHKNFVQDITFFDGALITVSYDGTIKRKLEIK